MGSKGQNVFIIFRVKSVPPRKVADRPTRTVNNKNRILDFINGTIELFASACKNLHPHKGIKIILFLKKAAETRK